MVSLPLANEPTLKVSRSLLRSDRGKTDPDRPLYLAATIPADRDSHAGDHGSGMR